MLSRTASEFPRKESHSQGAGLEFLQGNEDMGKEGPELADMDIIGIFQDILFLINLPETPAL